MRYPASEKLEIIRLVEQSHLPVKRALEKLGIPRATFYRWYDLYQTGGPEALDDHSPRPDRVWNRIPDDVRERIRILALEEPALSPRELAVRFTDTESYFVSEATVYRLLKALDLIGSPAFIVIKAADEFADKTTAPNELGQTDFTYLKVIGWGWFYLSSVLDDFSRYIIAWKLCTTMTAEDVGEFALRANAVANDKHTDHKLGIDRGTSEIAVVGLQFLVQVGQGSRHKHVDPSEKMIFRNAIIEAKEQLDLLPSPATHHHRALPLRWRANGITVRPASQRLYRHHRSKADLVATNANVRFVPIAEIASGAD